MKYLSMLSDHFIMLLLYKLDKSKAPPYLQHLFIFCKYLFCTELILIISKITIPVYEFILKYCDLSVILTLFILSYLTVILLHKRYPSEKIYVIVKGKNEETN